MIEQMPKAVALSNVLKPNESFSLF